MGTEAQCLRDTPSHHSQLLTWGEGTGGTRGSREVSGGDKSWGQKQRVKDGEWEADGGLPNTGSLLGGRRNAWMFFSSLVFSGGDGSGEMGVARHQIWQELPGWLGRGGARVEGMGLGVRRSEGKYGQASEERRYWGREFSQPHQLWPSFEFSEWILVSYARKARASLTHPRDSPHTLLCLPSHKEPSNKGVRNRGLGSSGGGVRWRKEGRSDEMDMEGDGVVGTTWKGDAHRPLWARSLKPSFSHLSAPSWHP